MNHLLLAVALFLIVGIVLMLVGAPYAWAIAAVVAIAYFVLEGGVRSRRGNGTY